MGERGDQNIFIDKEDVAREAERQGHDPEELGLRDRSRSKDRMKEAQKINLDDVRKEAKRRGLDPKELGLEEEPMTEEQKNEELEQRKRKKEEPPKATKEHGLESSIKPKRRSAYRRVEFSKEDIEAALTEAERRKKSE